MSTTSFLAFALLVVLITLSWSQPGKAAPTSDDADPARAADRWVYNPKNGRWSLTDAPRCKGFLEDCSKNEDCCTGLICEYYIGRTCVPSSWKGKLGPE